MLSSVGQPPTNQTLRLVDKDRLIAQRVRVKSDEKLISKTPDASKTQHNLLENLCDLSTDFDFNPNSNVADLLDLGNSQMSSFFREFTDEQKTLCKEEKKTSTNNYKIIKGIGFYACDSCPFLCLDVKLFLEHSEKDHHFHHSPLKSLLRTKCIGCDNIFYSVNVLRCHLIEDHDVLSVEIDGLVQLVIEANKEDTLYLNEDISQIDNNKLPDFNDLNDTILDSSEFGQKSHFIDTQITDKNNFIDNYHSNEISNDFWDYQEQVLNGLQENNTKNENNIIEKRLRCTVGTCKVRFGTEDNLKYHEKCHLDDAFRCIEFDCLYTDTKWLSMMSHLWKNHNIDIEMFSCSQCQFKTNSLYKLNTFHKNIHKPDKPFMCPECNKGFKSIKQLRNHKVIHAKTAKPPRADLICLHCSRNFSTKSLLHQHISSVHIRARPYACHECSYTTSVISSLRLHVRSHTGEKPFKCEECGYSTADHNTMRKHKMRHTGQKNYGCPLCNYSCIQASSYKKHLKTKHPGIDDGFMYSCDMCNFKTIRKDIYMLHIVKHKEETLQNNGICEPLVSLDEIFNEKRKKFKQKLLNNQISLTLSE